MAKIRHNNYIDTLVKIAESGTEHGVLKLYTEDDFFTGRRIKIKGKDLFHFGTTGYLGLEQDMRIKEAAIDAIMKFGTQFPLSKTYVSHSAYRQLEEKLEQMYGYYVLVTKNSTLGHMGVVPSIIRDEDAVLLDQQVHWSVQTSCQLVKNRDIPVEMIRHNDMDMLEDKIKELSAQGRRIWYFADGIYSMFGDTAPMDRIKELCKKYPQLYLYFDDVHGMSWVGKNGTGFVMSQYEKLPENIIVFTTLSKTFGASGATMITSNKDLYIKVKSFGGPLTFSAQLEPSAVAAAIASANIHLSPEIYEMQHDLAEKVAYCNECLAGTDLPLIESNSCPVFYIGAGAPSVGYNFVRKIMDAGYYVNMGVFPAVAVKKTGVRFTISRHNQKEDIKGLVEAMAKCYPESLKEESYTKNQVRRIFGLPLLDEAPTQQVSDNTGLDLKVYKSCVDIDHAVWDSCFAGRNIFDYRGLMFLEEAFRNNQESEHNWDFRYVIVKDANGEVVLATFFTKTLWKDDMLAPANVSLMLEKKREQDPYYHTSTVLAMGSLFTEGDHLFVNYDHKDVHEAIDLFFQEINKIDEELAPEVIALRDFEVTDDRIKDKCDGQGFVQAHLPESCVIQDLSWNNSEEYLSRLSAKSRRHFRKEIEPFQDRLYVEIKSALNSEELQSAYQLYLKVWRKNYDMNTFAYPISVFESMNIHSNWEFICAYDSIEKSNLVAVMFCYMNSSITYVPSLIGMDYDYTSEFSIYRQMLLNTINRAKVLNYQKIDFGLSASFEKRKVGASVMPKKAYIQAKDNFAMEMMEVVHTGKKIEA